MENPPVTPTTPTTPTTGGSTSLLGGASGLDWLKFLSSLYDSQKKGSFVNVPQTPQQTELYNFARGGVANLPDANNAAYPIALMGAASSPSLDLDKARRGEAGAYTNPERMSVSDLMSILQNQRDKATAPPAPGTPAAAPAAPTGPTKLTTKQRIHHTASGILKGLVGGLLGGPVGAITGAVAGGVQAKKENDAKNKALAAAAAAPTGAPLSPSAPNVQDSILDWYWKTHGGKPMPPVGG